VAGRFRRPGVRARQNRSAKLGWDPSEEGSRRPGLEHLSAQMKRVKYRRGRRADHYDVRSQDVRRRVLAPGRSHLPRTCLAQFRLDDTCDAGGNTNGGAARDSQPRRGRADASNIDIDNAAPAFRCRLFRMRLPLSSRR